MSATTEKALTYLRQLAEQGFWGFLTLKLENGHVVHVRQEENLKPDRLPVEIGHLPEKNRRNEYDRS